jgi:hypothetical protein
MAEACISNRECAALGPLKALPRHTGHIPAAVIVLKDGGEQGDRCTLRLEFELPNVFQLELESRCELNVSGCVDGPARKSKRTVVVRLQVWNAEGVLVKRVQQFRLDAQGVLLI